MRKLLFIIIVTLMFSLTATGSFAANLENDQFSYVIAHITMKADPVTFQRSSNTCYTMIKITKLIGPNNIWNNTLRPGDYIAAFNFRYDNKVSAFTCSMKPDTVKGIFVETYLNKIKNLFIFVRLRKGTGRLNFKQLSVRLTNPVSKN